MCLFSIHMSSTMKYLFRSFVHVLIRLCFFLLSFESPVFILDVSCLFFHQEYGIQIIAHSLWLSFYFLKCLSKAQIFALVEFQFGKHSFNDMLLMSYLKKFFLTKLCTKDLCCHMCGIFAVACRIYFF